MFTIPNILTMSRIAWIPVMIVLFSLESAMGLSATWICLGIYALASITDFFDGYLARKLNQVSDFGTFLDPISDKIFVVSVLVLLVGYGRLPDWWMIPVLLILMREFLVSGMREFLGPKNIKLPVTKLAKWKTTSQMVALGFLIAGPASWYLLISGQILLCIAALLTLITGYGYLKAGIATMDNRPRPMQ